MEGTSTIAKRGAADRRRGAEQSRTEMGNRQKVRGWLHTSLERASENNNLLGVFTVGVAYGQRSEAIRNESAAKNALRPSKRARHGCFE